MTENELLDRARTDIADAQTLLGELYPKVEEMAEYEFSSLTRMARDKLRTAYDHIDRCQNDLDVERELRS